MTNFEKIGVNIFKAIWMECQQGWEGVICWLVGANGMEQSVFWGQVNFDLMSLEDAINCLQQSGCGGELSPQKSWYCQPFVVKKQWMQRQNV